MEETSLTISNPTKLIQHDPGWDDFKKHALVVANTFRKEYKVIEDSPGQLVILNIPLSAEGKAIIKDQIIYVTPLDNEVKVEITNENHRLASYTELERDKTSLDIFLKCVNKSIDGTLVQSLKNAEAKKKDVDYGKAIIQIILLIVAIAAIFMGLKALA